MREADNAHITFLLQTLTTAIATDDLFAIEALMEREPEENIRKAAGRLARGTAQDKLNAGREFIFTVLAEKSNRRLMGALADLGKKVTFLAEGLDAVNSGLGRVDGSVRALDASSSKLGMKALFVAGVAVFFTIVQGVAAGIQIWKWCHGQ